MKRLGDLIREIRIAMLTTVRPGGHFRSRPMMTQDSELDDELWFFLDSRSGLVDEITECHQVNLVYVDPARERYVSVSGVAQILRESDLIRRYWTHRVADWFPDGPEDPHLAVMRVQLEEADYWDATAREMVRMRGLDTSEERMIPPPASIDDPPAYELPAEER